MIETPNPGSREAFAQGCICPRMDNFNGQTAPWPPDGWWIVEGCPLHSIEVADDVAPPRQRAHEDDRKGADG